MVPNKNCLTAYGRSVTTLKAIIEKSQMLALRWTHALVKMKPPQASFLHFCLCFISSVKPVCGGSWAALASSSPDLKVKITVHQVINTDRLARILRPEIPLTEYTMVAFYSPDEGWTAKPVLCDMLPQYSRSLQVRVLSRQHYRVMLKPKRPYVKNQFKSNINSGHFSVIY